MIKIIFESHKTSTDNEAAIFSSDLTRAIDTAEIIFKERDIPCFFDWRLREYNYGELEGKDKKEVLNTLSEHIHIAFPNGESVDDVLYRMDSFLKDLKKFFDNKTIVIIGHRATQLGLEHFINGINPETYIKTSWVWQPGWEYVY